MSARNGLAEVEVEAQPVHRRPRERRRADVVDEGEPAPASCRGCVITWYGALSAPMIINAGEKRRQNRASTPPSAAPAHGRRETPARERRRRGAGHQTRRRAAACRDGRRPAGAAAGSNASGAPRQTRSPREHAPQRASPSRRRRTAGTRAAGTRRARRPRRHAGDAERRREKSERHRAHVAHERPRRRDG